MEDARIDRTGFGDIVVLQREKLGYGVDAVLLSAFAAGETGASAVRPGMRVADLGTGSGIVAFTVAHKVPGSAVTGFDVREDAVRRAKRAAELNGMEDRTFFVNGDVSSLDPANASSYEGSFDAVVTNPPYFRRNGAVRASSDDRFIARHETTADLAAFVRASAYILKDRGLLYMVHRPDRLADIFFEMRTQGIEPKYLQLVVPKPGERANICLVCGIKGAGSELKVLPELAVHSPNGEYTDEINRIYER